MRKPRKSKKGKSSKRAKARKTRKRPRTRRAPMHSAKDSLESKRSEFMDRFGVPLPDDLSDEVLNRIQKAIEQKLGRTVPTCSTCSSGEDKPCPFPDTEEYGLGGNYRVVQVLPDVGIEIESLDEPADSASTTTMLVVPYRPLTTIFHQGDEFGLGWDPHAVFFRPPARSDWYEPFYYWPEGWSCAYF